MKKKLILINSFDEKVKSNIDISNLDDILRIDIKVISGDEVAEVTYKNGDKKIFDSDTHWRMMDYQDEDYCIYQAGKINHIEEWEKRKDSYDWDDPEREA